MRAIDRRICGSRNRVGDGPVLRNRGHLLRGHLTRLVRELLRLLGHRLRELVRLARDLQILREFALHLRGLLDRALVLRFTLIALDVDVQLGFGHLGLHLGA